MSDIGFSSVAANEMTMLVSSDKRAEALNIFQSSQIFVSIISIIVFLVAVATSWNYPIEKFLNVQTLSHQEVSVIILIMTFEVLINLQVGFLAAGFRCEGEYAKGAIFTSLNRFFTFGSISVAIVFGANPVIASFISLLVSLVCFISMAIYLRRCHPWISYGLKHVSLSTVKKLILPASAFMAFPIGNALSIQGLITVIGIGLGSKSVVVFSTLRTLSRFTLQVMNSINNAVWPELSMAFGKGDIPLVRSLHRRACQASLWLSVASTVFLSVFGLLIIKEWTIGQVSPEPILFYLMLLVIIFDSFWFTSSVLPISINQHSKMSLYYLVGTILSIFQAYLLLPILGLNAVALSLLTIDVLMISYVIRFSLFLSHDNFRAFVYSLFDFNNIKTIFKRMRY